MKSLLSLAVLLSSSVWALDLRVEFSKLSSEDGAIQYILFKEKSGFPSEPEKSLRKGTLPASEARSGLIFKDLEPGEYALSVIHDENENAKLDTNFLGIPKEKFGFSNNPKIYFGPPDFKEAAFTLSEDTTIEIELKGI